MLFWPLICYISFLQPTRMLFAYSFDGMLPKGITKLSRRGSPYVAVIITVVLSTLVLWWAVYRASNFFQVLVYATLVQLVAMGLVGLSAVVVPYVKPELYRAAATQRTVVGIPVMVIAGIGAIATCVTLWVLYFHWPTQFGLADKSGLFYWLAGTLVAAVVFYFGARMVRQREGVDIDRVFAEIPPE